jgi:hypothetical protein
MTTLDYVKARISLRPLGNCVYAFGKHGRWRYDPAFDRHVQVGPMIVHAIRSELKKEQR